jgi:hypothetical protein
MSFTSALRSRPVSSAVRAARAGRFYYLLLLVSYMPLANAKFCGPKWLPIRLLANHGSKMAVLTAADAMRTALELLRGESEDHDALQNQLTVSLDRHQTALDQMERVAREAGADPAVLRQIREAIRNPPQAPDAGGAAEEPAQAEPAPREEPVPPPPPPPVEAPAPAEEARPPKRARRVTEDDLPQNLGRTQRITRNDYDNNQIRIPRAVKTKIPLHNGTALLEMFDVMYGECKCRQMDGERSGILKISMKTDYFLHFNQLEGRRLVMRSKADSRAVAGPFGPFACINPNRRVRRVNIRTISKFYGVPQSSKEPALSPRARFVRGGGLKTRRRRSIDRGARRDGEGANPHAPKGEAARIDAKPGGRLRRTMRHINRGSPAMD